jgi:hypothetical protein
MRRVIRGALNKMLLHKRGSNGNTDAYISSGGAIAALCNGVSHQRYCKPFESYFTQASACLSIKLRNGLIKHLSWTKGEQNWEHYRLQDKLSLPASSVAYGVNGNRDPWRSWFMCGWRRLRT